MPDSTCPAARHAAGDADVRRGASRERVQHRSADGTGGAMKGSRRAATALLAGGLAARPVFAAQPGERVRWPSVRLLDGRRWSAADAQGRAVIVVFWSVTCPFCRRHNPHLEKLRAAAVGRPLTVLGVSRDTDADAVARHLREQKLNFAVTLDDPPMAEALSLRRVTPLTVTVGRDGRLRQVLAGEMFEEDVLELLQLAG